MNPTNAQNNNQKIKHLEEALAKAKLQLEGQRLEKELARQLQENARQERMIAENEAKIQRLLERKDRQFQDTIAEARAYGKVITVEQLQRNIDAGIAARRKKREAAREAAKEAAKETVSAEVGQDVTMED